MVFPVGMYGCESWTIKKDQHQRIDGFKLWCWRRLLRVPWTSVIKVIKPVNPKGNQLWIVIGRTDVKAETPILWPPDAKRQLIGKNSDAGKDWRHQEKGAIEDEMVGWHHLLSGHEFKQTPRDGKWQGSLVCYSPWSHKESNIENEQQQITSNYCIICLFFRFTFLEETKFWMTQVCYRKL